MCCWGWVVFLLSGLGFVGWNIWFTFLWGFVYYIDGGFQFGLFWSEIFFDVFFRLCVCVVCEVSVLHGLFGGYPGGWTGRVY